jgi:hypothetical protein
LPEEFILIPLILSQDIQLSVDNCNAEAVISALTYKSPVIVSPATSTNLSSASVSV